MDDTTLNLSDMERHVNVKIDTQWYLSHTISRYRWNITSDTQSADQDLEETSTSVSVIEGQWLYAV